MDSDLLHRLAAESDRVVHTHGSVVFLRGDDVYKVKKPVNFGFLDYSTLVRRGSFCLEEVRLNRRWSRGIYLGIVPVGETFDDALEPVEWAVHMRRYEEAHTLQSRWQAGTLTVEQVASVGRFVATVHRRCPRSPLARQHGTVESFQEVLEGVFDPPSTRDAAHVVPAPLYEAVRTEALARLAEVEEVWRARTGGARELHGDLRMEHALLSEDGAIDVVDVLEFNDALRCGDPVLDVGFMAMDLAVRGEPALARAFVGAWVDTSDDHGLLPLLPVAAAYRSCVRGKVAELLALDPDIDDDVRDHAQHRALRHWLWSASVVRPPNDRPVLLGIGGLPGTGKSTVAAHLAETRGMTVVRADAVRKQRAGLPIDAPTPEAMKPELYAPANTIAVYRACLVQAERIVAEGGRALIDATFADPVQRRALETLGRRLGVPTALWLCDVPEEVARQRISARPQGPSDADADVLSRAIASWPADPARAFDTSDSPEATFAAAEGRLDRLVDAALDALR